MAVTVRIPAKTFRKDVKRGRGVLMKTVHRKAYTRKVVTAKTMPSRRFPGMAEPEIKQALAKTRQRYVPVGGYAWIDVGRPKHHYVLAKKTEFGWKKMKTVEAKAGKPHPVGMEGRKRWIGMSHAERMRSAPSRKGRAGYVKAYITKTSSTGKRYKAPVWVTKRF